MLTVAFILPQVVQEKGVSVDRVRRCAVFYGKLFAAVHHVCQTGEIDMPAAQVLVTCKGDVMRPPGVSAVWRCGVARDTFVIMEIGMLLFQPAQFFAQVKSISVTTAVIEMNLAFVLIMQRITDEAEEWSKPSSGADHEHRVIARALLITAITLRTLDADVVACLQFIQ